jgi:hypothetical protein
MSRYNLIDVRMKELENQVSILNAHLIEARSVRHSHMASQLAEKDLQIANQASVIQSLNRRLESK